jgi:predicted ATPase
MELNRRHPLSDTLGDLTRERLFERVLLRGLSHDDVGRFIELAAGITPPRGLVDTVHTQTEGNPLFVTETVRLLIRQGDLSDENTADRDSWTVRIPEGVREVIGRRLDRLSESCNEALTTASIVGRQFTFGVLLRLIEDTSENMFLDLLEEALDARIIEEVPTEVGLYQFTHAQMQETLTSELSANRLVRLHAALPKRWKSTTAPTQKSGQPNLPDTTPKPRRSSAQTS